MKLLLVSISSILLVCIFTAFNYVKIDSFKESERPNYSGEDLYKGTFQLRGEYTKEVPLLNAMSQTLNPENTEEIERRNHFFDEVIENIKKVDPKFFNKFEEALKSKDHNRIEKMLAEAGRVSVSALVLSKHLNKEMELSSDEEQLLLKLAAKYDLTETKGLVSFFQEANDKTNLNVNIENIKGISFDIEEGADAYSSLVKAMNSRAHTDLDKGTGVVIQSVYAAQVVTIYCLLHHTIRYIGTSVHADDKLIKEKFIVDVIETL